jgi:hypothetical protein
MRTWRVLVLSALLAVPLGAQEWKQSLSKELVTIKDGKMVADEFNLVKIAVPGYEPVQLQLKLHAEAPQGGVISRDNVVALTSQTLIVVFYGVYA